MKSSITAALAIGLLLAPSVGSSQSPQNFVTVQPAGQWLVSRFIGQPVNNDAGEHIGDINDLLFDKNGHLANVVIGVGGFLGIGEKNIAMPFSSLSIAAATDGPGNGPANWASRRSGHRPARA